jgi:competence protein ComEC
MVLVSYWVTARWAPSWQKEVRITFLDVGQGDSAVVELPGGMVWMIDGGGLPFVAGKLAPEERARRARAPGLHSVARFLAWRRIDRIDVLVISHPHPDHYEGVGAVADVVDIGEVWLARGHERGPPSYQALLDQLAGAGARVVHPRLERVHRQGQVAITVLAPRYLDHVATADPVCGANDNSLVVRLEAYGRSVLFAGDLEREGEELLVARHGTALRADLVKVPHHGSPTSSTARFVAATAPLGAIVSCGVANRFGFPSASVVERWQRAGAQVFRTDREGAVTATIAPDGALRVRGFDGR